MDTYVFLHSWWMVLVWVPFVALAFFFMCRRGAMAGFLVMFVPVFVFAVFLELAPAWHFESLTDPVLKNRVETIQIGQRQFALAMIKESEREAILSSSDEENPLTFIVSTDDYRFVSEQGGVAHWKSL